jgi:hypothetical protein
VHGRRRSSRRAPAIDPIELSARLDERERLLWDNDTGSLALIEELAAAEHQAAAAVLSRVQEQAEAYDFAKVLAVLEYL